jgi:hypothetical protein
MVPLEKQGHDPELPPSFQFQETLTELPAKFLDLGRAVRV